MIFNRTTPQMGDVEINMETIGKDVNGTLVRKTLDELSQASSAVQRKMNSGLSQEEFKRHNAFKEGIDRAKLVLEQTWSKLQ